MGTTAALCSLPNHVVQETAHMHTINGYTLEDGLVDTRQGPEPDWATLYPPCPAHWHGRPTGQQTQSCWDRSGIGAHDQDCCYCCSWYSCNKCKAQRLTPRNAAALHITAKILAGLLRGELINSGVTSGPVDLTASWEWESALPPVAQRLLTVEFAQRYIACYETLAGRLAAGRALSPACTGEENAVHHLVNQTKWACNDAVLHGAYHARLEGLPQVVCDDMDFEWVRTLNAKNSDVLRLYDPALDGIESPEDSGGSQPPHRLLHPLQWFIPYDQLRDVGI